MNNPESPRSISWCSGAVLREQIDFDVCDDWWVKFQNSSLNFNGVDVKADLPDISWHHVIVPFEWTRPDHNKHWRWPEPRYISLPTTTILSLIHLSCLEHVADLVVWNTLQNAEGLPLIPTTTPCISVAFRARGVAFRQCCLQWRWQCWCNQSGQRRAQNHLRKRHGLPHR